MVLRFLLILTLIATSARAQEDQTVFAVAPLITSPLPIELATPESFHQEIVELDGSLHLQFVDLSVGARGWPLTFARRYLQGAPNIGLGPNWAWSFGVQIRSDPDTGTLFFAEDEGGRSAYAVSGPGEYDVIAGRLDTRVSATPDGGLVRMYADGSREIYDPLFQLVRREGEGGFGYTLSRDEFGLLQSIVHDDGQSLQLVWNANRLVSVTDQIGRSLQFDYQNGFLSRSIDPLGRPTEFSYTADGTISLMQLADGSQLAVSYDLNGNVQLLEGPGQLRTSFDHWGALEEDRIVQTRTDGLGRRTRTEVVRDPVLTDHYSLIETHADGVQTIIDNRDGEADVSVNGRWIGATLFDTNGDIRALVDARGAVPLPVEGISDVLYAEPDERGHPSLIFSSSGNFWVQHDAVGRIIAMAGETGFVERFVYDAGDQLISHLDAAGTTTTYDFDAAGRPIAWRSDDGRWQETDYSTEGLVSEIRTIGAATLNYTYDAAGRLASLSDGRSVFSAIYTSGGLLDEIVDESGLGIRFLRDEVGRVVEIQDDLRLHQTLTLEDELVIEDEVGRLRGVVTDANGTKVVVGQGRTLSYSEQIENGDTLVTTLLPDGQGRIERFDATGTLVGAESLSDEPFVIETDDENRVVLAGDPSLPSTITYDDQSFVSEVTDSIGVTTSYQHDENGRLTTVASPYLGVEYIYDGDNPVPTGIRTSEGQEFSEVVSADGRQIRRTATDRTGSTRFEEITLDEHSRIVRQVTEDGVVDYAYPDENTTVVTLQRFGRTLTWVETYDPETRVATITRPDGGVEVTQFDRADRVVSQSSPERVSNYDIDPEGLLMATTVDGHRVAVADAYFNWKVIEDTYQDVDEDGIVRVITIQDPMGNLWREGYGADGRAYWSEDPNGQRTTVARAATGQITQVVDPEGRTHYATYDDLGRATETGVLGGWSQAFGWQARDPAGQTGSGGAKFWIEPDEDWRGYTAMVDDQEWSRYDYDDQGRISSASTDLGAIEYTYAEKGELAAVTDPFGRTTRFEYDEIGRLSALVLPEGDRVTYAFGAGASLDQTGPDGVSTTTVYDPQTATISIEASDGTRASVGLDRGGVLGGVSLGTAGSDTTLALSVQRNASNAVSGLTLNSDKTDIEYDALGRLSATQSSAGRQEWAYDASGNKLSAPDGLRREYNSAWQLTQLGQDALEYDLDGRLVRRGETTYDYDPFGRMIAADGPDGEIQFFYNAFGELIRRVHGDDVEDYLWAGGELLAVYDASGQRLALLERNPLMANQVRLHTRDGTIFLVPDQVGSPRFAMIDGTPLTLPAFGAWGGIPEDAPDFIRWFGYTGAMTDPVLGIVHTAARPYFPQLGRFGAPDPLGIDNPVNPYSYANLDPYSLEDRSGHNGGTFNPHASNLSGFHFDSRFSANGTRWGRLHNHVVNDLERALRHETRPHIRNSLQNTLNSMRSNGLRMEVRPAGGGYGSYGNNVVHVNPATATTRDPRFRSAPGGVFSPRAVGGVIGHEARHHAQALSEAANPNRAPLGRLMKEFDAHLHGTNVERAVGGFHPPGNERRLLQQAMDYSFRTEYRSYLPEGSSNRISNTFRGTGHPTYNGILQMTPDRIADIAQRHMPEVPRHQVLDDWVRTAERWRANPAAEAALRAQGENAAYRRDLLIRQTRQAAARARTAAITPPRPLPNLPNTPGARATATRPPAGLHGSASQAARLPGTAPTNTAARTPAPRQPGPGSTQRLPAANTPDAPRSGPGSTQRLPAANTPDAPRTGPGSTQRLQATRPPGARTTQRLPASDLPDGARGASTASRPSGSAPNATRPTVQRPASAARNPAPRSNVTPPEARPRPPATQSPPPRNSRPSANPNRPSPRPTSAPDRPTVRQTPPRSGATPDAPNSRSMPQRPQASGASRPPQTAPRPSAQGGRYPRLDLEGNRVAPPPRGATRTARVGRPPRVPRGALHTVPGPSLGTVAGRTLGVLGVAADLYNTHRYITGQIGHREYWSGIGLSAFGMFSPYPVNAAIAAWSVGGALGSYAANSLLEAAANGDRAAIALLNWMRESGFINASDPTFVAIAQTGPPLRRAVGRILVQGEPQWVAVNIWAEEAGSIDVHILGADGDIQSTLGAQSILAGSNTLTLPLDLVSALPLGDFQVVAADGAGAFAPILPLRVVEGVTFETEVASSEFSAQLSVVETRLQPTDLPWERFDRPETLLSGPVENALELGGVWDWIEDPSAPSGQAHVGGDSGPPVHYSLFESGTKVQPGDNIIQYFWLDPGAPPAQVVLQVYDDFLSGAHRIALGEDLIPFEDAAGFGSVSGGGLPEAGQWMRLRVPVEEIGMDGRTITGLAFYTADGVARFGPTRLSGPEDTSPRLTRAADRDRSGDPEAELLARLTLPEPGTLSVRLVFQDGGGFDLFEGPVSSGTRSLWWQGDAALARGARLEGTYLPDGSDEIAIDAAIQGNPALVARLLFPPNGAVVRQTVPFFGQTGGDGFKEYVVEVRRLDDEDAPWALVTRSNEATVMTDAQVRARIESIIEKQLRPTVFGNVASIHTGSKFHRFEFFEDPVVLDSGWIELRLRSFDEDGNFAEARRIVQIGEVATGQDKSVFVSSDGNASMTVPPMVQGVGMGTFAVSRADANLPSGAPEAASEVYGFSPAGLLFRAPLTVSIQSPTAQSIAVVGGDGQTRLLAAQRDGDRVVARIPTDLRPERFYATDIPFDADVAEFRRDAVPWIEGAPAPGLIAGSYLPQDSTLAFDLPIDLEMEQPLALVAGVRIGSVEDLVLLLRFDDDVRLVALGQSSVGSRPELTAATLGLEASQDVQPIFLPLDDVLPSTAKQLQGVELVKIVPAAWRVYSPRNPTLSEGQLVSVAIGTLPETATGWRIDQQDPIRPEADGWTELENEVGEVWPIFVDTSPPELVSRDPMDGQSVPNLQLAMTVEDIGAGIAAKKTELTINDVTVPASLIAFDPQVGQLSVALGEVPGLQITNGGQVSAALVLVDRLGQRSDEMRWSWTFRPVIAALGDLRQLTSDGGQEPAWRPDGQSFVLAAQRDGQFDLFEVDLETSEATWLTDTPEDERHPAIAADGTIGFVTDNGLGFIGPSGVEAPEGEFSGITRFGERWLATRDNVVVDLADPATHLCEAVPGATLLRPRVLGDQILVTQSIYHRTIWQCDPATGTFAALSLDPEAPETRDVDATAVSTDALLYAKQDGAGGIWRRTVGTRQETLEVANEGGLDRSIAVAPDMTSILFESGRSGRTEIWQLMLQPNVEFALDALSSDGRSGAEITGRLTGLDGPLNWSLLDAGQDGTARTVSVAAERDEESFVVSLASDLSEGVWQIQARDDEGMSVSQSITIDRSPPELRVRRVGDGADIATISTVAVDDQFELEVIDVSDVFVVDAGTNLRLSAGTRLSPTADVMVLRATDAQGLTLEASVDLSPGEAVASRWLPRDHSPDSDPAAPVSVRDDASDQPDQDTGSRFWIWIVLALAIGAVGAGAAYARRRT